MFSPASDHQSLRRACVTLMVGRGKTSPNRSSHPPVLYQWQVPRQWRAHWAIFKFISLIISFADGFCSVAMPGPWWPAGTWANIVRTIQFQAPHPQASNTLLPSIWLNQVCAPATSTLGFGMFWWSGQKMITVVWNTPKAMHLSVVQERSEFWILAVEARNEPWYMLIKVVCRLKGFQGLIFARNMESCNGAGRCKCDLPQRVHVVVASPATFHIPYYHYLIRFPEYIRLPSLTRHHKHIAPPCVSERLVETWERLHGILQIKSVSKNLSKPGVGVGGRNPASPGWWWFDISSYPFGAGFWP